MPIDTAKRILNDSIKNFVCVDDQFIEPFHDDGVVPVDLDFTKKLYGSFHSQYKNMKILQFKPESTIDNIAQYFSNADIVILDWELGKHEIQTTIKLLVEAIKADHVKYIFIYTNNKEGVVTDGLWNIRKTLMFSFMQEDKFYNKKEAEFELLKELVLDKDILNDDTEIEIYLKNIESKLFEFLFSKCTKIELNRHLFEEIKKLNASIGYKDICPHIGKEYIDILLSYLKLNFLGNFPIFDTSIKIKDLDKDIYLCNDKLVNIVSKTEEDTKPENLLNNISEFILSEDDSYFNILSHEILYHFKQNFMEKAKSFAKIDNKIIKCHVDYLNDLSGKLPLKELVDGIYRDVFMSVLKNQKLDYIEKAGDFFNLVDTEEIDNLDNKVKYINSLISIDHTKETLSLFRDNKKIEFGDVFIVTGDDITEERYAICITPHCDCAHPAAGQEYKFIFSKAIPSEVGNTVFDSTFCTFLPVESEIKIVMWKPSSGSHDTFLKSISLALYDDEDNNIDTPITMVGLPLVEYKLNFVAQQKENFTQRLLNESARHGIRVGVSYLNIKDSETCSV